MRLQKPLKITSMLEVLFQVGGRVTLNVITLICVSSNVVNG